ncbi:MAG: hypothetical protein FJ150_05940 [Euryarchaeota archaeon]|nr:hypothetical protein [Euryarchaeota archaeon]
MNEKNDPDFRIKRYRLPLDAFLIAPKVEPPPEDLIDEKTWVSIIHLPDDVSFRTSDHHGTELRLMHELWGSLINQLGEDESDVLWHVILDITDEFQSSLINLLYGFYRVSATCLRSALEISVYGSYFQLSGKIDNFKSWRNGAHEDDKFKKIIRFGNVCDQLNNQKSLESIQNYLKDLFEFSLFNQKNSKTEEGWARQLFSKLSKYSHLRPTYTSGTMWEGSTGPVYIPNSFGKVYALYFDTMLLIYVLIKLSRPQTGLSDDLIEKLFSPKNIIPAKIAYSCFCFLWPEHEKKIYEVYHEQISKHIEYLNKSKSVK